MAKTNQSDTNDSVSDGFDDIVHVDSESVSRGMREGVKHGRKMGFEDASDLGFVVFFDRPSLLNSHSAQLGTWI